MTVNLKLRRGDSTYTPYTLGPPSGFQPAGPALQSRVVYAAAHVVCYPLATINPTLDVALDWESTLAYRRYLWSLGLAVAEAMDTAQRGMGLSWEMARELVRRSLAEARAVGGRIACGAGTDQLTPSGNLTLADVEAAYST